MCMGVAVTIQAGAKVKCGKRVKNIYMNVISGPEGPKRRQVEIKSTWWILNGKSKKQAGQSKVVSTLLSIIAVQSSPSVLHLGNHSTDVSICHNCFLNVYNRFPQRSQG